MAVVDEYYDEAPRSGALCIDNKAALAALARAPTTSELWAVLVGAFWAFAAYSPIRWWAEYVHAASKAADSLREPVAKAKTRSVPTKRGRYRNPTARLSIRGATSTGHWPDYGKIPPRKGAVLNILLLF